MKVLSIMTTKLGKTGISNVVKNTYENMNKSDIKMDFIFPNKSENNFLQTIQRNGGEIYYIKGRMKHPLSYYNKLVSIMSINKYTAVHVHGNSNTMTIELKAAKKAGIPIRIAHGHSTSTRFPIIHRLLAQSFKNNVNVKLSCGKDAGKFLYGEEKFTIIDNGIDTELYKYDREVRKHKRELFGILDNEKVILQVGTFNNNKKVDFIMRLATSKNP